jgi:hypothetical protein
VLRRQSDFFLRTRVRGAYGSAYARVRKMNPRKVFQKPHLKTKIYEDDIRGFLRTLPISTVYRPTHRVPQKGLFFASQSAYESRTRQLCPSDLLNRSMFFFFLTVGTCTKSDIELVYVFFRIDTCTKSYIGWELVFLPD